MSHLPRIPIRFIAEHADMLKSQTEEVDLQKGIDAMNSLDASHKRIAKSEALSGGAAGDTNWKQTETPQVVHMEPQFRAPGDRNIGNVLFRRNPDGMVDLDAGKDVVVDILHRAKDGLPLTELEKVTLGVMFPALFAYVDHRLAEPLMRVHLRLNEWEVQAIVARVAAHLAAEMNYNAGLGGGGEPGRSVTRV